MTDDVHVLPLEDKSHTDARDCWCRPTVEHRAGSHPRVIHKDALARLQDDNARLAEQVRHLLLTKNTLREDNARLRAALEAARLFIVSSEHFDAETDYGIEARIDAALAPTPPTAKSPDEQFRAEYGFTPPTAEETR